MRGAGTIRLLVLDVDGVLTDGRLYFGPRGEALKVFDVRDGYGLAALQRAGVVVAVISGRRSRTRTPGRGALPPSSPARAVAAVRYARCATCCSPPPPVAGARP